MKTLRLTMAALALSTLATTAANAQATRTWVSGVGDDANPCSRTAPCKTFAGAISKTAAGGEINVLDPGGFGAVTITKSISIEADGVIAGVLVTGTNGIVVAAGINDTVVLRGLTIDGVGTGIDGVHWQSGRSLVVEKCTIKGFTGLGINAIPTTTGVTKMFVSDTQIRDNAGGGIFAKGTGTTAVFSTVSRVHLNNNNYGIRTEDNTDMNVKDSIASQSTTDGFVAHSASANAAAMFLEGSAATSNIQAGIHANGSTGFVFISNTLVTGNNPGLLADSSGQIFSWGNNLLGGNFTADGNPTTTLSPR